MMSAVSKARPLTGALLCHLTPLRSFKVSVQPVRRPFPGLGQVRDDVAVLGRLERPGFSLTRLLYQVVGRVQRARPWLMSK